MIAYLTDARTRKLLASPLVKPHMYRNKGAFTGWKFGMGAVLLFIVMHATNYNVSELYDEADQVRGEAQPVWTVTPCCLFGPSLFHSFLRTPATVRRGGREGEGSDAWLLVLHQHHLVALPPNPTLPLL